MAQTSSKTACHRAFGKGLILDPTTDFYDGWRSDGVAMGFAALAV
jgi:hypothetical protein